MLAVCFTGLHTTPTLIAQDDSAPAEPLSIKLLEMDLTATAKLFARHDLDDDGALSKSEYERLKWTSEDIRPFDLNRSGDLQQVEVTLKLAAERERAGIVQMDSILADRYTKRYDSNRDGKLQLRELENNTFSDQIESYDRNSDDELSADELIRGLAFERKFRDELGVKGCDQGGAMALINQGDLNGDRQLGGDELGAVDLDSATMKFDRNDNESLSVSELAEYLADRRMRMGMTPSDQLLARNVIRRSDPDGDGLVPANLFRQADPDPDPDLGSPDENGDGLLSLLEIETYLAKQRKLLGFDDESANRASILIARNDSNGDRKLSKAELKASGANRDSPLFPEKLSLIDQDGDAAIDMKELARFIQKTRRP
ncbi:hypothetical protein [Planctomycetes bacterium TBK1r]|uniref:hypothetical protein n=1 Tax=Stieleria magnilauensis TaxID=2527963 RepID=UPI0011AB2701